MSKKFFAVVGFLLLVPWMCFGIEQYFEKLAAPDSQNYIVLTKPTLTNTLDLIELGASFLLLFTFCYAVFKKQNPRWKILLAIGGLNVLSYILMSSIVIFHTSWGDTWEAAGSTHGTDGKVYYFIDESLMFGPGFTHALARGENDNPFWFRVKILGEMGEDEHGAPILRPKPLKPTTEDEPYRIYSTSSGWIAIFADAECQVAYNIKTKRCYAGWKLRTLSPFILVGIKAHSHRLPK